ncbi:hypothetical protein [Variovorax boronicumulans]|uniref:hypothetical protein n=1 Tax=Variovorax boronicumulans TaxID=436515 RepID=UPI0027D7E7CF|nr:hypothetical protein [Variovorax boronicumulans]
MDAAVQQCQLVFVIPGEPGAMLRGFCADWRHLRAAGGCRIGHQYGAGSSQAQQRTPVFGHAFAEQ